MPMRNMAMFLRVVTLALSVGCYTGGVSAAPAGYDRSALSLDGDFPLGEATNRYDYLSIDADARRLYIAKMGAGTLQVFDLAENRLVFERGGFPKATGVLVVPDLHRVYVSVPGAGLGAALAVAAGMTGLSAGSGAVAILDTQDLHEVARLPGGVFPDGIAYDPKHRRVFVSDELGGAVLVIDAVTDRLVARIALDGGVGNVQYDPQTEKIYAPIQSRNLLAVIDPLSATLVGSHPLPGADHPHGLAIAPGVGIGYVACDGNDRLLAVELATGKILSDLPVAHDPDVLTLDAGEKRLYVSGESGMMSRFDIANPAAPTSLGDRFIAKGAHSVAADPATHRLYFPLADLRGHAFLRVMSPVP